MLKNEVFSEWTDTKSISHPLEPVKTSFFLITFVTGTYDVTGEIFSTQRTRVNVVKSKFVRFISFTAINTGMVKMFLNRAPPQTLGFW
jgi:hypothetical protein